MNPSDDISVIKAILFKSREKLETAQIDFDNGRYNDSVSRSYYRGIFGKNLYRFKRILEEIMAVG
ncbi:MAG TPA: hypothetical protein VJ440_12515 [Candidatus Brocadiaceae bacterium]|nr:hypothetical protein [Candidatus Brocadiaceae bacterium]